MGTKIGLAGGFKTRVAILEREINRHKRRLAMLVRAEEHSRKKWTKAYHAFLKAVDQIAKIKIHGTKKEERLKEKISGWKHESVTLTLERNDFRTRIKETQELLVELGTEQTKLAEQQINETNATDEIVTEVLELNAAAVRASECRETYLNRHIFPRLIDEHGNLRSQITFTSSNDMHKVVAMVNTMTIVRGDLAAQAKVEIERFFGRFQKVAEMDDAVRPLYDLTRELLVEKTDFKVGPDLYRFLAMNLDFEIFPELRSAQTLLRQSIRSEKTNSYIRIYKRADKTSNWEPVPQS